MIHNKLLNDCIEKEIAGTDYVCPNADKPVFWAMIGEINAKCNTSVKYLAELDAFHVIGAGAIVAKYIKDFSCESVKAYLIPQLVLDRVTDCDKIIFHMYLQFRKSNEYISAPGKPAPSHICTRYDSAFHTLKSKRIASDIVKVLSSPRDAFYLPLTTKLLASWKVPALKPILLSFLNPGAVTIHNVGLREDEQSCFPPFSYIRRELVFTAIYGLGYYPSIETEAALFGYLSNPDRDIRTAANKIYKKISSR